jgi:hypothetical protein
MNAVLGGAGGGGTGMLGQGVHVNPLQNVYNATSDTSFAAKLKQKLAKL